MCPVVCSLRFVIAAGATSITASAALVAGEGKQNVSIKSCRRHSFHHCTRSDGVGIGIDGGVDRCWHVRGIGWHAGAGVVFVVRLVRAGVGLTSSYWGGVRVGRSSLYLMLMRACSLLDGVGVGVGVGVRAGGPVRCACWHAGAGLAVFVV